MTEPGLQICLKTAKKYLTFGSFFSILLITKILNDKMKAKIRRKKMKNKKIIITLIFTAMFLLIFTTKSDATLQLNNLDFYAQINEDGSMDVTETWNIYISETNTIYKTFKIDNSKYSIFNTCI